VPICLFVILSHVFLNTESLWVDIFIFTFPLWFSLHFSCVQSSKQHVKIISVTLQAGWTYLFLEKIPCFYLSYLTNTQVLIIRNLKFRSCEPVYCKHFFHVNLRIGKRDVKVRQFDTNNIKFYGPWINVNLGTSILHRITLLTWYFTDWIMSIGICNLVVMHWANNKHKLILGDGFSLFLLLIIIIHTNILLWKQFSNHFYVYYIFWWILGTEPKA
jgi:hypothetical protein